MSQPALPSDAATRLARAAEIRALLHIARAQGWSVIPDPDRRGIAVGFPKDSLFLTGAVVQLLTREEEAFDYLVSLKNLASAVVAESLPSPGESSTEGVAETTRGSRWPEPRTVAPSNPLRISRPVTEPTVVQREASSNLKPWPMPPRPWPRPGDGPIPCPACDPGKPCLDHGGVPEESPKKMPRWMLGVIGGLLAVLTVVVCYRLWVGGGQ